MATEDYYGDDDAPPSRPRRKKANTDDDSSDQTTTIAKSLCPGMEVDDVIKFKIIGVLEDEYQVRYVKKDNGDEDSVEEEEGDEEMPVSSSSDGMYD